MSEEENRRPLKVRGWKITQNWAAWLSTKAITPNQISLASIVFSAFAAFFFFLFPFANVAGLWALAILVPLCLFGRGLCNIFDGLVAIEGSKFTASGELFNDVPDRISDVLIIVACGYACGIPELGWLAATLSVITAYARTLSRSIGAPSDFQGPMGKVPRMAVVGITAFLTPMEFMSFGSFILLKLGLVAITIGCVITIWKRLKTAHDYLEDNANA
mgnify:CR=1 FL=1